MKNVPERIYLTLGEGANEADDFKDLEEVSWCSHKVYDNDIEYSLVLKDEQCVPMCGDNHCEENGCVKRKRELKEITESLPPDVEEAARQWQLNCKTDMPRYDSFIAGYNHALTQNTAKDKQKDELLRRAVNAIEAADKELASRFHGDYDKSFELMSSDLKAIVHPMREIIARYNSLSSTNNTITELK